MSSAMRIARDVAAVRAWRHDGAAPPAPGRVGFVPTMGYLHDGHLSLVARARRECDRVAASIFVNPAQFDRADDLAAYPRDLDRDLRLLRDAGCDLVFTPEPAALYPPGFETWVEPGEVAATAEGAHRPGHFRGVATVVLKLLNVVQPTRAYFGQKDAQQLAVVRRMVRDLDVPVEIVAGATVREADGLAMSSRNVRLGADDRRAARVLHRALEAARDAHRAGERDTDRLRAAMRDVLAGEPRATVDYVSVADRDSFRELATAGPGTLASLAVTVGGVRLIDNLPLDEP